MRVLVDIHQRDDPRLRPTKPGPDALQPAHKDVLVGHEALHLRGKGAAIGEGKNRTKGRGGGGAAGGGG